ncbi:MAG: acetoin utilization protein AcuC [Candidatus Heimdallarchaeota archaeon]|nr:acetoin utilization protein AcuC [Candidatus Heimdallarchaeota archaeon]
MSDGFPKVGITIDERMLQYHLGDAHPMNSNRIFPAFNLFNELFINSEGVDIIAPLPMTRDLLEKAHDINFIQMMEMLSWKGEGSAGDYGLGTGDCPVWQGMAEAAEFVAGSTVTTADNIFKSDYSMAFSMLGGLHHARSARASGFCYYNDINVAIHRLKQLDTDIKILYVDTDLHHGDGVQFDFYNDPNVLTISFHESGKFLFPGTGFPDEIGEGAGTGYSINVPFMPYTIDDIYLNSFDRIVKPIYESYNPDFIIWQSGVDGHRDDYMGHLLLSLKTYEGLSHRMRDLTQSMDTPRMLTLGGGGYNPNTVAKSWATIMAGLLNQKLPKLASVEWLSLCRKQGIDVTADLHEEKTSDRQIAERNIIRNENEKYMLKLIENIKPYFSVS